MRRLIAILLAAGPLAAAAQTAGQISITGSPINASGCASTSTATLGLTWVTKLDSGVVFSAAGSYAVYASSAEFFSTTPTSPYCYTANSGNVYAAQLTTNPSTVSAASPTVSSPVYVYTKDVVAAANLASCTAGGTTTIYLCVQWLDGSTTVKGYAKGTVTLELTVPAAPTVAGVWPGNGALVVNLTDNSTSPAATSWQVKVVNAANSADIHYSGWETSTSGIRIEGLVNGTGYYVTAFAQSAVGNVSPESRPWGYSTTPPSGTPVAPQEVLDAWGAYKAAGGRDSGGCDAGPAGLAAFLGAAALLRVRRRS